MINWKRSEQNTWKLFTCLWKNVHCYYGMLECNINVSHGALHLVFVDNKSVKNINYLFLLSVL